VLDEGVPHFDVLSILRSALEHVDCKIHIALLAKLDETPREFIRLQKRGRSSGYSRRVR
jgi:hypothetical protein